MLEGYNGDPHLSSILDFFLNKILGGSDSRASAYNVGDPGLIPGLGRSPGGGYGNALQYSCLENPYGQRNLAGYSPRGHKESDTTEQLSTAQPQPCGPEGPVSLVHYLAPAALTLPGPPEPEVLCLRDLLQSHSW